MSKLQELCSLASGLGPWGASFLGWDICWSNESVVWGLSRRARNVGMSWNKVMNSMQPHIDMALAIRKAGMEVIQGYEHQTIQTLRAKQTDF